MASASSRPANDGRRRRDGCRGGERDSARGIVPGIALRTLEGQRLQTLELTGDDRFLPIEELDARIDRLREDYGGHGERHEEK